MSRRLIGVAVAIVAALALAACGDDSGSSSATTGSRGHDRRCVCIHVGGRRRDDGSIELRGSGDHCGRIGQCNRFGC